MKNKKKRNKKHTTRNDFGYTPGRNMFGEKSETHLIVLKRETALQQVMDQMQRSVIAVDRLRREVFSLLVLNSVRRYAKYFSMSRGERS